MATTESLIVELDAKTKKLEEKLKKTQTEFDNLSEKTKKTDKSLVSFQKAAAATAVAITLVTAATVAAVRSAGSFAKELTVASNRAGESVERMQSLAFASGTVGISLEKLGDIAKDTNEKIGEFLSTGGGGFKDFIDVMGLSAQEARDAAEQFEKMSGPDVLQEMVNQMERVGVSSQRMSFALEGVASDTTDLMPLLIGNGKALKELRDNFNDLNITISESDLEKITEVNQKLSEAAGVFDAESKQLIADYSDELIKAIEVTVFLGQKTSDAFSVITGGFGNLIELAGAALNDFVNGTETFQTVLEERTEMTKELLNNLFGEDLYNIGKEKGEEAGKGFSDGVLNIEINGGKKLTAWEKLNDKQRLEAKKNYFSAAKTLSGKFLEDNKAINAGLIVADAAVAVMRQFKDLPFPAALASSAAIAATAIVQLSDVMSARPGGGSVSGGGSGAQVPQQQNFQQETSSLELTDATSGGAQSFNINVPDGDEIGQAIANWLNKAQEEGR